MRLLETDLKQCIKAMKSGYYTTKDAERIKAVMERALAWITGKDTEDEQNHESNL